MLTRRRRDTGPTRATRAWLIVRDACCCVRCGLEQMPGDYEIHHRLPRGMGGTSKSATNKHSNLLLLCRDCHAWIEANRAEAYVFGWLVRRWQDPLDTPVMCKRRGLILLDNNGEWKAAE